MQPLKNLARLLLKKIVSFLDTLILTDHSKMKQAGSNFLLIQINGSLPIIRKGVPGVYPFSDINSFSNFKSIG